MRGRATLTKRPVSMKENQKTGAIMFELAEKTHSAGDAGRGIEIGHELKIGSDILGSQRAEADEDGNSGTRTPPELVLESNRGYSTMDFRRGRPYFHESPLSSPKGTGLPRESAPSRRRIDVSRLAEATSGMDKVYDESPATTMDELTLTSTCIDLYIEDLELDIPAEEAKSPSRTSRKTGVSWKC